MRRGLLSGLIGHMDAKASVWLRYHKPEAGFYIKVPSTV